MISFVFNTFQKIKKYKWCFRMFIAGFVVMVWGAWYLGFIPIASGQARAGMRNALDVKVLPSSVRVNASGSEAWTDYIFEVDFKIAPEQFEQLFAGRKYQQATIDSRVGDNMTSAYRIKNYTGFEVDAVWEWSYQPPNMSEYDHGAFCFIYVNKARDRVFIRFTAD